MCDVISLRTKQLHLALLEFGVSVAPPFDGDPHNFIIRHLLLGGDTPHLSHIRECITDSLHEKAHVSLVLLFGHDDLTARHCGWSISKRHFSLSIVILVLVPFVLWMISQLEVVGNW
jgi:hypothetical protein